MNFATDFLMNGTPWEWEYAPIEPISASSSLARSITSAGKTSFARVISSGYSVNAATCNVGLRKLRRIKNKEGKADLSSKGDRWLIEALLLRVPDVGRHDLGERQRRRGVRVLQRIAELFSFDRQLTADGVLDVENGGVEIVDGEHRGRRKPAEVVVD
jgi:hypothetical protein